jgi:quinol-cytochrome oxidoreductase complex cytochrome b subunit
MELPNHSETHLGEKEGGNVPFFPDVLLAEASFAIAIVGLLLIFAALFPLKLGEKFDPMNPPTILEPEWYFMGVYQFLKTQDVQPLHGILLIMGLGIFLVLVPFLDRGSERHPLRRPVFASIALIVIVEFLALTTYGYMSPGQVGSLSNPTFVFATAATTLVALCLVLLVLLASKHRMRGVRQ